MFEDLTEGETMARVKPCHRTGREGWMESGGRMIHQIRHNAASPDPGASGLTGCPKVCALASWHLSTAGPCETKQTCRALRFGQTLKINLMATEDVTVLTYNYTPIPHTSMNFSLILMIYDTSDTSDMTYAQEVSRIGCA